MHKQSPRQKSWESVEKKKLSWRELWDMQTGRIGFMLGAIYDVLPSPQNLSKWKGEDQPCNLCSGAASIKV